MSDRPRVLVVVDRVSDQAGAEASTVLLVRRLQGVAADFRVVVVGGGIDLVDRDALEAAGVRFYEAGASLLPAVRTVRRVVAEFRPDLVHAVLFRSELVARVACYRRVPVLGSIVNSQYSEAARAVAPSPRKLEAVRWLDGFLARHATAHFHAVSEAAAAEATRSLGVDRSAITVIRRGRDTAVLGDRTAERRARVRQSLGVADDVPLVLAAARQEPQKRLDLLVEAYAEAAATHPKARLVLAGRQGSASSALVEQIAASGMVERIDLLGQRDDVADLMVAADVYAMSSLFEGLPGVVIEALALELPVVGFDVPTVREAVGDAGVLVEAGDTSALAAAIGGLLDDPGAAAELAERGRRRFDELFGLDRYVDEFADLYRSVGARAR